MRYAEVAVDAPIGYGRTLSYAIPAGMRLVPGQLVRVPLGRRLVQGVVFGLSDEPGVEPVREVAGVYGSAPLVSPSGLELSQWISRRYLSSLFEAASLLLPSGFRSRSVAVLRPAAASPGESSELSEEALRVLSYVRERGAAPEEELGKEVGRGAGKAIDYLISGGWLERSWELERPRAGLRYLCLLHLAIPRGEVDDVIAGLPSTAIRQAGLLRALKEAAEPLPVSEARKEFGSRAVKGLLKRGYVAEEWTRVTAGSFLGGLSLPEEAVPRVLTSPQEAALGEIISALEVGRGNFLLHGVTGSGKTEVYLRAMERCLGLGKQALFLVPEISLTPQALGRLTSRFPGRVAVLHSGLSDARRLDQWWQVREGVYDIVVGPRSALFAPLARLGLIVVDEEHEWTYKQVEQAPRYHAREVALELARLAGTVVVMGSATPDVATYYWARRGRYRLLELPGRIASMPPDNTPKHLDTYPLADVEVVDMRRELREGNRSIFSRALQESLERALGWGEQVILFLNRRGSATLVQCRDCGHVVRCRRCDVPLVYHAGEYLLCHQCNARSRPPVECPQCGSRRIRYLGLGTERVVAELGRLFPGEEVLRWDRDVARVGSQHQALMERFAGGDARILVGTQMIAKGLHVPSVTLVGVMLADVGLYMPDLWAGERAFQLLCQVAGRAGRGPRSGRVIIQTYNPAHYAVKAGACQSYPLFYQQELEFRRQQGNPPFSRMAHLLYQHANDPACQREAERVGRLVREQAYARGMTDVEVIGPAPAYPQRVRGRYRWHIILRAKEPAALLEEMSFPDGWTLDIDPVSVL
jgi:primosomal protein N' (replication factor Y)